MTTAAQPASYPASSSQTWDPHHYDARAPFVSKMATDLVGVLDPRAGERILDLGCGTGELAVAIAASGANVLGVDASAAMIDAARRRAPALTFAMADGQELAYVREFDAVFSNAALHWMPRAAAVAEGVARALRPGGRFIAEFGGRGCVQTVRDAVSDALRARGQDPGAWLAWYFPDVATYVAVLDAAGFDVAFAHRFDRPTPVEGDDGLDAWMRTFLPRLVALLGADWDAFARDVERACAPKLRGAGSRPWVLDYVRLRISARLRP